ncbi:MAG: glycosyl transferase [Okeania sp. SIO3H1]|uniref:glycosyltransferase family 10 domain-containing protein n=1 Tax=Okeania sp. SIO1I7 TaxID=2607772 RepID=UPI0013CC78A2|nr:glycosyltransferase family 10 [Okeania sp. SIO1I7]NEN93050.1 glycosyl transferase [Okeania sp. SIO3H1]NET24117.1 glycosyl transferase [Okeania sp. SIO1I7]
MIEIFKVDNMEYTPFIRQVEKFAGDEIVFSDREEDCDVFVTRFFQKLKPLILQYGSSKKYLVWTHEPRFDTHFNHKVSWKGVDVHIMNIYTGDIYLNNYYFFWRENICKIPDYQVEKFGREKHKKIAALIKNCNWNTSLICNGQELDLYELRKKIALQGYQLDKIDIYGKGWQENIVVENSRSGRWQERKIEILQKYHFNLCFENTIADYYCTEKIWDSIISGCLPIYYGGKNSTIYEDFEKNSFLDYTEFRDSNELFEYVEKISIDEFNKRLNLCIQTFNKTYEKVKQMNRKKQVVKNIVQKLKEII